MNGPGQSMRTSVDASLGAEIAAARRGRGLTQCDLAGALGMMPFAIDRIERGEISSKAQLRRIAAVTGISLADPPDAPRARTFDSRPVATTSTTVGMQLVIGAVVALVLVRFFTEVVHVVPRAANFVDIPIFVVLAIAALAEVRRRRGPAYFNVAALSLVFLGICVVSAVTHTNRVELPPVLVFVYGFLAPLGVYAAVYRIWPAGNAFALSRVLVALGLLELAVVLVVDVPRFAASQNPDDIGGTFGTNAYQLVFFLLIVVALLTGIATFEPGRSVARFAPLVILASFATILLAQYRSLLVGLAVAAFVIAVLLGGRARGIAVTAFAVVGFVVVFSYVARDLPVLKLSSAASSLSRSPGTYVSGRLGVARAVFRLYSDIPSAIVIGTGPGTYSSRAWQTFANAGSTSRSNVAGGYALGLVGGHAYSTDVSNKYVQPQLQQGTIVQGSHAATSPYSSYTSLLAEVGVFGFALIVIAYFGGLRRAWKIARQALRAPERGDPLPAIALATVVAFVTLVQLALLENWFEVTRATFITWTLLAVTTKEFEGREGSWQSD